MVDITLKTIANMSTILIVISKMHKLTHIKEKINIFFNVYCKQGTMLMLFYPYNIPKSRYHSPPFTGGKRRLKNVK